MHKEKNGWVIHDIVGCNFTDLSAGKLDLWNNKIVVEDSSETRGVNCSNTGEDWIESYRTPEHWTPNNSTPLKTILVNFVICRNDTGGNGWQDTPEMRADFEALIGSVNETYTHPELRGYSSTCPVPIEPVADTKIRFKLNNVYFLDSTIWNLHGSLKVGCQLDLTGFVETMTNNGKDELQLGPAQVQELKSIMGTAYDRPAT